MPEAPADVGREPGGRWSSWPSSLRSATRGSAGQNEDRPAGCFDERVDVNAIAGQDAVAGCADGHHAGVDSVLRAGLPQQYTSLPAQAVIDRLDVDGLEETSKVGLPPGRI